MHSKTIVITGANGLLGQKLVTRLAGRQAVKVIATSKGPNRNPLDEGYSYESVDITEPEELRQLFKEYQPTEIVNCAAMTNVDQCEKDPEGCMALNTVAVKEMVGLCREYGVKMIHVSTDFIFDGENGPYQEKDRAQPVSLYGRSKLLGEEAVLQGGIPFAIARTQLVYGVVADMSRGNIVLWAKQALENGQEIKVVNDQWRSPTLAEDLAEGIIQIIMKEKSGIFHLSGPETFSIYEMVMNVADFWGLDKSLITPIDSATLNQPAKRPPRTGFIIIKAQTELGFKPHKFKEGLELVNRQIEAAEG